MRCTIPKGTYSLNAFLFAGTRNSSVISHSLHPKRDSIVKLSNRVNDDIILKTSPHLDMTSTIVSQCLRDREVVVSLVPDLLLPSGYQEEEESLHSPAPRLGSYKGRIFIILKVQIMEESGNNVSEKN